MRGQSSDCWSADRRTYEERNLEELRERARELDMQGRSVMGKDELIAALRQQAKQLRRNRQPRQPGSARRARVGPLLRPG